MSGTVTDAAGAIVDALHVGAIPADRSSASSYARGSGGRFVLPGLTPGRYLIRASVGGPEVRGDTRPPAREEEVGYTSIDVVAADIAGATIQLSKGRRVSGRFVFEGGSPAPPSQLRMAVHAGVTDSMWAMTMPARPSVAAVSDKLTFELSGLYELPVTMAVTGLPDGWVVKSIRNDGEDITGVPTIFEGGAKPGSLEIVATNRVATPAVRVTDERGDPVSSCHVVLFSVNPARWRTPVAQVPGPPTRDGVVTLGSTLPGTYLVAALTPADYFALMADGSRFEDLASVATRVSFDEKDARTHALQMTRLPAARGR